MNPVVGLDVAKGESQVQAFLDQSKPYGKSFSMKHIKEELEHFLEFLKEIEEVTGQMPMVILESTGHYHSPVVALLPVQVGYGKNGNELTGALLHYQKLLFLWELL